MGIKEDLAAERSEPKSKIDEWLETLDADDRNLFLTAIRQPKELFSHEALARVANKHGAKINESTVRRYRSKINQETT